MSEKRKMTLEELQAYYIKVARKHGYPLVIKFLCEVIRGEQVEHDYPAAGP